VRPLLTPQQREHAVNAGLGVAYVVVVAAVTLWAVAALMVGSVVIGRWIEGWA